MRQLHTLKGNAGLIGITSIASLCHTIRTPPRFLITFDSARVSDELKMAIASPSQSDTTERVTVNGGL